MAKSDSEYVEGLRKVINSNHRMRWVWASFHLLLLAAWVVVAIYAGDVMQGIGRGAGPGFPIGVLLGFTVGIGLIAGIHGLMTFWYGPRRCQRLVVEYYDKLYGSVDSSKC